MRVPKQQSSPPTPPTRLLWLAEKLFERMEEREAFVQAIMDGNEAHPCIIEVSKYAAIQAFPRLRPLPWQPDFVHRLLPGVKISQHPAYESGALYPLDFSSVFSASVLGTISERDLTVLDVCASPGGKAILAHKYLGPKRLKANEALRKRVQFLEGNLKRCKIPNVDITTIAVDQLASRFPTAFDLVIVDAPCSGQSLPAKGHEVEDCFKSKTVEDCINRQRKILGHTAHCVRPDGYFMYSTCTFELGENEGNVKWLLKNNPTWQALEVPHLEEFRSPHAPFPCNRLYPHQGLGSGAFVALIKVGTGEPNNHPEDDL